MLILNRNRVPIVANFSETRNMITAYATRMQKTWFVKRNQDSNQNPVPIEK